MLNHNLKTIVACRIEEGKLLVAGENLYFTDAQLRFQKNTQKILLPGHKLLVYHGLGEGIMQVQEIRGKDLDILSTFQSGNIENNDIVVKFEHSNFESEEGSSFLDTDGDWTLRHCNVGDFSIVRRGGSNSLAALNVAIEFINIKTN